MLARRNADGARAWCAMRQVADFVPGAAPHQINRKDLTREIPIIGQRPRRAPGTVGQEVRKRA